MDIFIELLSSSTLVLESTIVFAALISVAGIFMVKRKPVRNMDDVGPNGDKKVYLVLFRLGSKVEDKSRPFNALIVAAYMGFEGESVHNYQGLVNSTNGTTFVVTTNHLHKKNEKKSFKNQAHGKSINNASPRQEVG